MTRHSSSGFFQRFRNQEILDRITPGNVVVAVSGGADSVTLLQLMKRLAGERGWKIIVGHVQHNLRGKESDSDERFVRALSRKWDLPCEVLSVRLDGETDRRGGKRSGAETALEERARILRYRSLADIAEKVGASVIVTAHNANDQAETFLLNLLRGSGTDGLSGILPERRLSEMTGEAGHSRIRILRPLLDLGRAEILDYDRSQKLRYREDKTNRDLRHRRNWVRHRLIPLLTKVQPGIVGRLRDLTAVLRQERRILDAEIEKMKEKSLLRTRSGTVEHLDLVRFFEYNIALRFRFLHHLRPESSYREISRIHALLERKKHLRTSPLS